VTTGWDQITVTMTLYSSAPTYTNGDGGTYTVATNYQTRLGQFTCTFTQQNNAAAECVPNFGTFLALQLGSSTIYWDLQATQAVTPISGQTFNLIAEVTN
jgi:hypothetical protein